MNNAEITSLVGKQVSAQTNKINVSSGSPTALNYTLPASATVTVTITELQRQYGQYSESRLSERRQLQRAMDGQGLERKHGSPTAPTPARSRQQLRRNCHDSSDPASAGMVYSCNLNSSPPTYTLTGPNGIQVPVSNVSASNQSEQHELNEVKSAERNL